MRVQEKVARALHKDLEQRLKPISAGFTHTPWEDLDDDCRDEHLDVASKILTALDTSDPIRHLCEAYEVEYVEGLWRYFEHLIDVAQNALHAEGAPTNER